MNHKNKFSNISLILTFLYIPAQILLAIVFSYLLARNATAEDLNEWYLFFSLIPLFSLFELSYPILAVSFFNSKFGNSKGAFLFFIKNSLGVILPLQLLFCAFYSAVFNADFFLFSLGLVLRSIGNIMNSYLYANKFIVIDKTYRFLYSAIMPISFILFFFICKSSTNLKELTLIWFWSSVFCLIYPVYYCIKVFSEKKHDESVKFKLPFINNLRMFLTILPAIFIYTLPINYLKIFDPSDGYYSVIMYGFFLQAFNIYNVVIILVASYLIPTISCKYYNGENVIGLIGKILDISILTSLLAILFLAFFGGEVTQHILKGKVNSVSNYYILAIIFIFFIETCQVVLTSIGNAIGIYKFHLQSLSSAVLVFILSAIFIPDNGVIGLMYSIIISQFITCFLFNPIPVLKVIGLPSKVYIKKMIVHFLSLTLLVCLGILTHDYSIEVRCFFFLIPFIIFSIVTIFKLKILLKRIH